MDAENQNRFEVTIQPFSEKVSKDSWIEFNCRNCASEVKATPKVQREMSFGGIGHRCSTCNTHYAFVACPSCQSIMGLDDKE